MFATLSRCRTSGFQPEDRANIFTHSLFKIINTEAYHFITISKTINNPSALHLTMKPGVGVGVMILKDGKVLLGKRHSDPEKADSELSGEGSWTMPGGKLDMFESFEEGARRETEEETGIIIKDPKVFCMSNDMTDDAHFVTVGLFCDDFEGEPAVMEPDEITQWRWFSLDDLPKPLFFPSARVLENYKKDRFYFGSNR